MPVLSPIHLFPIRSIILISSYSKNIEKLGLKLYVYGEALYNAVYHGYDSQEYGENIIFNLKLSFKIKKFHFYYVFQNIPSIEYYSRANNRILGRYNWYGVTWEFLD